MTWLSKLKPGMPVHALDGPLGSIVSVPRVDLNDPTAPAEIIVVANAETSGPGEEEFLRVTRDMIEHVTSDELHLNQPRRDVPRASRPVHSPQHLQGNGLQLTVPVVEEDLAVETRVVELGHVSIHKRVEELLDERTLTLLGQEVELERVVRDEIIPEMVAPYMDGDEYVIPIIDEEIVIERRLRLREELRVRRALFERQEQVQTPYRRERVYVKEHRYDQEERDNLDIPPT
jgi:stress response protein YsnF